MSSGVVAEYGSGSPVIGILGEFDALPGLSQKTVPTKDPLNAGQPGHGCGHNLFGVASLGAAISIKELIEDGKLQGTVRFYGTPAEEKYFGKLWMIRAGLFDDVDVVMDWHPSAETKANVQSSLALVDFMVEFHGQAAHASADPWNGRSASDALELYTTGINYYREHVKPTVRIHYHIQDGGQVVNVVPDYSRIWVRVRDTKREGLEPVYAHVQKMAEGAAIMADVEHEVSLISGIHEVLVNRTGGARLQKNLAFLGPIEYTEAEQFFGKKIQEATGKEQVGIVCEINPLEETQEHPMGGSTDVGDVSFVAPTIRLGVTTAPKGTPWHSWAVVACGGMSIGHKGMHYASKALAMTMVDLFEDPELRKEVKAEFVERKGDYQYEGMVPPGPPPINSGR
ncbi:MAG: amidohydrolase [Bacteroidota bacterium]